MYKILQITTFHQYLHTIFIQTNTTSFFSLCTTQYNHFNPNLMYYHISQCACIYQNLHRNFVLLHSQKSKTCVHKSICTLLHNTISLIQINLAHFSQSACIYQNLHKNSHKYKTCAYIYICTLLHRTTGS